MDAVKRIGAMLGAFTIWGLSPVFYKLLDHVPPLEVLSHRTLWSGVFFGALLMLQGRLGAVWALLAQWSGLRVVLLASVMISVNWFFFIYAIQVGRTVETSLGYYIYPLVSVLFGMLFFAERLSPISLLAVVLAALAVAVLTVGLGAAPWMSLVLAVSFAIYGVIKKRAVAGPVVSVTAEVMLLVPLAAVWLLGVHLAGWSGLTGRTLGAFGGSLSDSLLLMLAGPLTATPLILFSYASRRVSMATIGLVQYLNPTLQFLIATLIFFEPFTPWHTVAFPLIWAAVLLYSLDLMRQERASRRASVRAATDSATPM